jgi:hypothetical protein
VFVVPYTRDLAVTVLFDAWRRGGEHLRRERERVPRRNDGVVSCRCGRVWRPGNRLGYLARVKFVWGLPERAGEPPGLRERWSRGPVDVFLQGE